MSEPKPSPPRRRIGELGPVWISSIAALITALATAGFFAGRASAPSSSNQPLPVVSTSDSPLPTVSQTGQLPASAADTKPKTANGTQLAAYTVNLSADLAVDLGTSAPAQSNFYTDNYDGDIKYWSYQQYISTNNSVDQMVLLTSADTPTYAACKASTVFEGTVSTNKGTDFCVLKPKLMIGISITGNNSQDAYLTLSVTVWQNE